MAKRKKKTETKFVQYSKKLSTAITVIWCVLRFAVMISSIIRPEIADAMVSLIAGADTVMIINVSMYTGNSTAEKAILAWLDKSKINNQDDDEDAPNGAENG